MPTLDKEEKKKRAKKLVVEETSFPNEEEVVTENPQESTSPVDEINTEPDEVKEVEFEEEVVHPKKESPKESLLIPNEEKKTNFKSTSSDDNSKTGTVWVILLALFIIASIVGGGFLVFSAGVEKGKLEAVATPTSLPASTPAATTSPSVEVKREDLKIQVLNGTGKAGVAASAKTYLEGLGYEEVETGNASSSDFTETEISIKDSKKAHLETLMTDLEKEYEVAAGSESLSSGSDFDAVVTIGTSTK